MMMYEWYHMIERKKKKETFLAVKNKESLLAIQPYTSIWWYMNGIVWYCILVYDNVWVMMMHELWCCMSSVVWCHILVYDDEWVDVWVWCLSCNACDMYMIYVSMHDVHDMFDALDGIMMSMMMFPYWACYMIMNVMLHHVVRST